MSTTIETRNAADSLRRAQVGVQEFHALALTNAEQAGFYDGLAARTWTHYLIDNVVQAEADYVRAVHSRVTPRPDTMPGSPLFVGTFTARNELDDWLAKVFDLGTDAAVRSLVDAFRDAA